MGWQYMSPLSRCKRIPSRSRHHQNGTKPTMRAKLHMSYYVLSRLPLITRFVLIRFGRKSLTQVQGFRVLRITECL